MLSPLKHLLSTKRIILASGSPRRKELIRYLDIDVELCPSLFEENLKPSDFKNFPDFVEETAYHKAMEVFERLKNTEKPPDMIIAADTIVVLNEKMFGKPHTSEKAYETLSELNGRSHIVYTGVVIKHEKDIIKFTESTTVFFGKMSDEQIKAYVATGEPLDKAGAYGILGRGSVMVDRIDGDFYNIVGLPLRRLSLEICKIFDYNQ